MKTYMDQIPGGHVVERCAECHAEITDDAYHLDTCSWGRKAPAPDVVVEAVEVEVEAAPEVVITEEAPVIEAPVELEPETAPLAITEPTTQA